jgi:hypothetical protein
VPNFANLITARLAGQPLHKAHLHFRAPKRSVRGAVTAADPGVAFSGVRRLVEAEVAVLQGRIPACDPLPQRALLPVDTAVLVVPRQMRWLARADDR